MTMLKNDNNDFFLPGAGNAGSLNSSLRFILVETSRPGNIGAAARAMKTMGYSDLVLVRPRFPAPAQEPEAIAFASGALDVLEKARIVDSMEEALIECNYVAAVSARLREFSPPVVSPRAWASQLAQAARPGEKRQAAVVFGNERFGLPNTVVEQCDVLINIPANPAYSSLNLAQAVQIVAYECATASHFATDDASAIIATSDAEMVWSALKKVGFKGQAADKVQVEAMFRHLEQAMMAIGFLDRDNPKRLMSRIRRLFARTGLETEEVNILRGIAGHILGMRK